MNAYAVGSLDALAAYALEKEAVDFLSPEMAKYMRRTLLGIPVATFLGARALGFPESMPPPKPPVTAFQGTRRHYDIVSKYRGQAMRDRALLEAQKPTVTARR